MKLTEKQIDRIISEAKFEFFNSEKTFEEIMRIVIHKLQDEHLRSTVQKAGEIGEQLESLGWTHD